MLKGHVFKRQYFGNQIFALFINTFLAGKNGISDNYKNGMPITYSGSTLTIGSGAACIQGRFVEEDLSTDVDAGTESMFCKLVIELDLDKQDIVSEIPFAYKVIKSASAYPELTQTNIVKNNAGIYQYELARFKTSANGITDFQDMRTFLDFDSIYEEIRQHIEDIDDGSAFVNKNDVQIVTVEMPGTNARTIIGQGAYPEGFNRDNCMIIGWKMKVSTNNNYMVGTVFDSSGIYGSMPVKIQMTSSMLSVTAKNIALSNEALPILSEFPDQLTWTLKIALLKVS